MLKKKALRKIFISTLALFVFITMYFIESIDKEKIIPTNLELEYVTGLKTNYIYLLNSDNYLVKTKVLISQNTKENQIKELIEKLIIDSNNTLPDSLKGVIPSNTKVLDVFYDEGYVTINLSKEFLKINEELEEKTIESIVYSIYSLKDIKGIYLKVDNKLLEKYPNSKQKLTYPLTKKIGINKEYDIEKRENINKVVVYYLNEIDNDTYYVPVTKYLNNNEDKIKIIIDSLTTSYIYEPNLMSFLNNSVRLNEYNKEENVFFLDFNNSLYEKNNKVLEEVIYSISYSVFDNYDVDKIIFSIDNKNIKTIDYNSI